MIVFPAGMYATASMRIGSATGAPAIHDAGSVAVWIAAAVWALAFAGMLASPAIRNRTDAGAAVGSRPPPRPRA